MFENSSSYCLTTLLFFFIKEILLLLKKIQHRKAQKGIPDRMIFVKNLENDQLCELTNVEFLNKAVEVTDWRTERLVSPKIILSEIRKIWTLIKFLEYFNKKKKNLVGR